MAKGKGKKVSAGSGLRKKHGPKKHMFKEYKPMVRAFAQAGLLSKYHNFESWQLAMAARGSKKATYADFKAFVVLSMEEKKAYFASLKK